MNQDPLFVGSFREDGRRFKENRSIEIKMGVVKESSGSCLFNLGETKVIAWIKGPCETKSKCPENSGIIKSYFNMAPFSGILHKSNQKQDLKDREFGQTIKTISGLMQRHWWRMHLQGQKQILIVMKLLFLQQYNRPVIDRQLISRWQKKRMETKLT